MFRSTHIGSLKNQICIQNTSWPEDDGKVSIRFERMDHLMGNGGIFGPYGNGNLFGPIIRKDSPLELLIDPFMNLIEQNESQKNKF